MKKRVAALVAMAAAQPSMAAEAACPSTPVATPGVVPMTYSLVMKEPAFGRTVLARPDSVAGKGAILARQTIKVAPIQRYLASDMTLADNKGVEIAKGVPLAAGSQVTLWRGPDGERSCSIGWRNGLFGGATGEGHFRWVCFEDRDGDGAYENAWVPRTKNLGLTYSRLDMPILPPVRWTAEAPAAAAPAARNTGVLGGETLSRQIEVRSANSREVRLEYWGAGVTRDKANRVTLKANEPRTVTLGGVTVALTPVKDGWARVTTTGQFEPLAVKPLCDGTHQIGEYRMSVEFIFPNW